MSNFFSPIASKTRSKNKINTNPLNNLNNLSVCLNESNQQQQQPEQTAQKRGRGRPPKITIDNIENQKSFEKEIVANSTAIDSTFTLDTRNNKENKHDEINKGVNGDGEFDASKYVNFFNDFLDERLDDENEQEEEIDTNASTSSASNYSTNSVSSSTSSSSLVEAKKLKELKQYG
jgi:hypothetical protein